jgi:hypothetical protein
LELDVEAVNAELDRQAEDAPNLSIPFRVIGGSFGSLQVEVPWSKLMSKSTLMKAHGLKISVEAHDRHAEVDFLKARFDSERMKKILEARAKSIVSANEHRLRKKAVAALASSGESSFSSRLVRRIIENIQIEINDVHISLESGESSAGVIMQSLTLFTTDARGTPTFVDRTSGGQGLANSFLHKALQIKGLGIYLDENESIFCSMGSINEESTNNAQQDHSYILAPLSFEATLRQTDSNVCIEYPKYLLSSKLPSLSIILKKSQLEFAAQIACQVRQSEDATKPLFPEYRPLRRLSRETAAEWWKYAYQCVARLSGRRAWSEFYQAFKRRKLYIPLYKREAHHASCHWLNPLEPAELSQLKAIENDRTISIEGIMAWRNIADAQFDKEKQKFDKTQAGQKANKRRSYFFGTADLASSRSTDEDPPITLTAEEMKELESISMAQMAEEALSNDSKLCNIHFVLGSLRINLTSYDLRPVVSLNMGKVSSAFKANADGSFVFGLKLFSLDISDMVTPKSLFPNILSSLRSQELAQENDIFMFNLSKTKEGDQKLTVRLVSFHAIASPLLLTELKRFFTLSTGTRATKTWPQNPLLAQSLSGSVDLFYDADEGADILPGLKTTKSEGSPASPPSNSFSNALIDAWKSKTETKATWLIDLDIRAPILVLPENCVDPCANVLILDLGHLQLRYGKIDESPKIQAWFQQHPKCDGSDPIVDNGRVGISHLTFMVTETSTWLRAVDGGQGSAGSQVEAEAVVEPISISFDLAIESVSASEIPRCCVMGVVPSIVLRLSPSQVLKVFNVYNAWKRLTKEFRPPPLEGSSSIPETFNTEKELDRGTLPLQGSFLQEKYDGEVSVPIFHFGIWLQRLSLMVAFDEEGGVDAHLVSVNASFSSMSDSSSEAKLSMGWFWVLDRFRSLFVRRQRLIAHSSLPLPPESFAVDNKYAILEELEREGIFEGQTSESSELANVSYKQFSSSRPRNHEDKNQYASQNPFEGRESGRVDAKFSSLHIHWNPQAVKTLIMMLGKFCDFLESSKNETGNQMIIISEGYGSTRKKGASGAKCGDECSHDNATAHGQGFFVINAEMRSFEISLNSARDDLPLFVLTMSRAKISTLSTSGDDLLVSLALGDFRLTTPETGATRKDYRTLLGLAPAQTESLLCAKYYRGAGAMSASVLKGNDMAQCEAFADVELSPMRMVYIHSQVMALVEYISEGILGALAAQAASSAVAAAADIATASNASRLYHVRATAFDFVLPQSAKNLNFISVHAGELNVVYKSLVDPGGGQASISLSDVSLRDHCKRKMQEETIRLNVEASVPPLGIGTIEEQTMHVDFTISSASFLLSKSQYSQIMFTLDQNLCEVDLFLRDAANDFSRGNTMTCESSNNQIHSESRDAANDFSRGNAMTCESSNDQIHSESENIDLSRLTHAGVMAVIIPRRMCIKVKISVLSLELFTASQPLIRIAAVDAKIDFRQLPDEAKKTTQVTLGNLVCDDQRPKAVKRQYQSLIYQIQQETNSIQNDAVQDVFFISYESMENGNTNYDIKIGSPRIVCVPDVVNDLLSFVTVEGRDARMSADDLVATATGSTECTTGPMECEDVTVGVDGDGGVEVSIQRRSHCSEQPLVTMSVSVTTSRCSIVLVDLGGNLPSVEPSQEYSQMDGQVVENLVFEGKCSTKLVITSSKETSKTSTLELQLHGDAVEVYTAFGRDMRSPLQVLEPAQFSLVLTRSNQRMEVRAAALTPFNLCFSMRNYALINELLRGLGFLGQEEKTLDDGQLQISDQDALRIEQLASKLENGASESTISRPNESVTLSHTFFKADANTGTNNNLTYAVSVRLTLPELNACIVNDLLGLDDALFRITVATFVAGGELRKWLPPVPGASLLTTFDCHVHTSILADYFDASANRWKKLLTKPWELALRGARGASRRFQSDRLSTTFDIESFPVCISTSEQFLVGIGAASRMWSIYSIATSSSSQHGNVGATQRAVASAARNLITTLPYALENHFGLDVDFLLPGSKTGRRRCASGTIQYFRFEPPAGLGYGGERLYGDDVLYKKGLQLFVGDSVFELNDLDAEVGKRRRAHVAGNFVLFTIVKKEGKTRVSFEMSLLLHF